MLKTLFALLSLLLVTLAVETARANHHEVQADIEIIDQHYADWRAAVERSDIPSYLTFLHDDIRLMPPGAPVIEGAANYGEFLRPVFEAATYKFEVDAMPAITVVGDFAFVEYTYTVLLTLKDAEAGITQPGALTSNRSTSRYFDVLRRTPAGWRLWRHTWHVMDQ